jgi:DNA modification methylase
MKNIEIKNLDCFDFLVDVPSNSVDLVLVDPPYEISRTTGFSAVVNGVDRFAVSMDFGEWDYNFNGLEQVIQEFYRILKKGGTAIIFYDLWKITNLATMLENSRFKQLRFIEWIKTNPVPLNSKINYLTNGREIAITAIKGSKPKFYSEYDNGIYEYPIYHGKDRWHPTQKPIKLFEELILKHSDEGDVVLDCFSGSGTTALAAKNTKRSFIGCELSQEYYEKSIKRIKDVKQQVNWQSI